MDKAFLTIDIIETSACPYYQAGDELIVEDRFLSVPDGRKTCLGLARVISDLLPAYDDATFNELDGEIKNYECKGQIHPCTGRIKFTLHSGQEKPDGSQKRSENEIAAISGLLKGFSMFSDLDDSELSKFIHALEIAEFKPGEVIIEKGKPGKNLYIILSGNVDVLEDRELDIAFLGSGEVFGEMSLISGEAAVATVRAATMVKALFINGKLFRKILHRFPKLRKYFALILARRLVLSNDLRSANYISGMTGKLSELSAAELFQTINILKKNGLVCFQDLSRGRAYAYFQNGNLLRSEYGELTGSQAFQAILAEKRGRFLFSPATDFTDLDGSDSNEFIFLLMEGLASL